jgi:type III restriction enzyme
VQQVDGGEQNWIVETKGRVYEGTDAKDDAMGYWCEQVTKATGTEWRFMRVNQRAFEQRKPAALADLVALG